MAPKIYAYVDSSSNMYCILSNRSIRTITTVTMKTKPSYNPGDRIFVKGGVYKGRYGVYIGTYGTVMCSVKIDNDTRQQRNIWQSSIQPTEEVQTERPSPSSSRRTTPVSSTGDMNKTDKETIMHTGKWKAESYSDYVNVSRQELEKLLEDIANVKDAASHLEKKIKDLLHVD
jgi:hypothetical protein